MRSSTRTKQPAAAKKPRRAASEKTSATSDRKRARKPPKPKRVSRLLHPLLRRTRLRILPAWALLCGAFFIAMPGAFDKLRHAVSELAAGAPLNVALSSNNLAPLFTPEIRFWGEDIERWAAMYGVDPNLLATVMQIESCGHADISSSAGAQGLFQVMPFHFSQDENQTDPETNARRGASFLAECMAWGDQNPGKALACYNGGPGVLGRDFTRWPAETQRYYVWGGSIYVDARGRRGHSDALDNWLNAGGARLCELAAANIAAKQPAIG